MSMQRDTVISEFRIQYEKTLKYNHSVLICSEAGNVRFLLVLGAKNEKGAGFRQWNGFFLQLQVGHWSGPRADGDFRLFLFIITYHVEENRLKIL